MPCEGGEPAQVAHLGRSTVVVVVDRRPSGQLPLAALVWG